MLNVAIAGGSGYGGGELLRLLLDHPEVQINQVTSHRFAGKLVSKVHPNLRKRTALRFCQLEDLEPCDLLFLSLPHGHGMAYWEKVSQLAPRIIDLSADFRLDNATNYETYYQRVHARPELLGQFVYGIPEVNRDSIRAASFVACAGCNATASILGLHPLFRDQWLKPRDLVIEVKVGSSESGNRAGDASHHPVRSGAVRSFKPTGHRHVAEIQQVLNSNQEVGIHFSATAIEMVRGVLATSHLLLDQPITEKQIWQRYRQDYGTEPFIRIVKERDGLYRYPEPKLLAGTNYCDIGFELDPSGKRLVVMSAIDNLMKGAAGQAVQNLNIMFGFPEQTALNFAGLHPI